MYSVLKKYYQPLIILTIIVSSAIGMLFYKELLENSRLENSDVTYAQYSIYETYFSLFKYALILTLGYIILSWFFNRYKDFKQLKNEKAKAELSLLKSQINPHFFFNTLNNLYGLTIEKSTDAPNMILKLSDLMRYTIYEGKEDFIDLESEISYLKNFIELHQLRYKTKVDITFDVKVNHPHKIAPLLFIILLENAFKHGVENLSKDAYINSKLYTSSNNVVYSVENNFKSSKAKLTSGMGLANLKHRLNLIYPQKHDLNIEQKTSTYCATLDLKTK